MRTLDVYIDSDKVGQLCEGDGLWSFRYERAWADHPQGYDLSPQLPRRQLEHVDEGTLRPVQWYFDNLLPEEGLRKAVAREAAIRDDQDAFALLQYLGAESAGSLTLLPPGVALPVSAALQLLPDATLGARIADIPRVTLTKGAPKRMSLAGAQHKLLAVCRGADLFEPVGATPSTHILKPNHPSPEAYPESAFNEHLTMRLAREAKLDVPAVSLRYQSLAMQNRARKAKCRRRTLATIHVVGIGAGLTGRAGTEPNGHFNGVAPSDGHGAGAKWAHDGHGGSETTKPALGGLC